MIGDTVELRRQLAHHLQIGRVTKIVRHEANIIGKTRATVVFEHVAAQVISGLTSVSLRCVKHRGPSLGEGRKLDTICRRRVEWHLEQLLAFSRIRIDSDTVNDMRVKSHHSTNGQIGTFMRG